MDLRIHAQDDFTIGYLECAVWSSTDDSGNPMDDEYGPEDIAPDSLASMIADCQAFQSDNADDLAESDPTRAGHDFWLTRNHHGAGFWDGDYPDAIGKRLTDAAHVWGSSDLTIGDDGKVYCS